MEVRYCLSSFLALKTIAIIGQHISSTHTIAQHLHKLCQRHKLHTYKHTSSACVCGCNVASVCSRSVATVEEIASPSCSAEKLMHVHTLPCLLHSGLVKPAVSLPSQFLPRAGVPAADLTPCVNTWLYSKQDKCVQVNIARLPSAGTVCYSLSGRLGSFTYLQAWTADPHIGLHLTADQPQT